MRVLLISGAFPPDRCGVGDYTRHLAEHLSRHGSMEISVLTGNPAAASNDANIVLFRGAGNAIGICETRRAVRAFRPDVVHVQYPTMRPISRLIPAFARHVLGIPVVQTWHEHYAECVQLGLPNLLGLQRLIHVREDMLGRLPRRVRRVVARSQPVFIPNGCTIPPVRLAPEERARARQALGRGRPVVAYFGFAYPNKDVHVLFEIANPASHHLLLICDLDCRHPYQRKLVALTESAIWRGHTTVTGYVPPEEAGRLLACADAVVFPFPGGVGHWNTSVKAALASGTFVLGTTSNPALAGYSAERNLSLVPCGDRDGLRRALATYLGRRREPDMSDEWLEITQAHERIYASLA